MDNSVKIWIEIRRGKDIVQRYVKKIKASVCYDSTLGT